MTVHVTFFSMLGWNPCFGLIPPLPYTQQVNSGGPKHTRDVMRAALSTRGTDFVDAVLHKWEHVQHQPLHKSVIGR